MKKIISVLCVLLLCCTLLSGCNMAKSGEGGVYYLNFKPEQDAAWKALAKKYTDETGVKVTVVTAASGQYEDTLSAEIVKSKAPTLFQVNGPVGLASWKDYCYDLSGTEVYNHLTDESFALKDGPRVLAIAYVLETYGILYNEDLLDQYFALPGAKVTSLDKVNNFTTFKALVEDIQSKKDTLGIKGAFTSAGMDASSDWRFKSHLANLPIAYEYTERMVEQAETMEGRYLDQYRQIWDLYLNNATCAPTEIGARTGDEAASEFMNGQAVFYQNGTWAWNEEMEEKIGEDDVGMLPIYIGAQGEEAQGLCTGSENYWCVNKNASEAEIQATLKFLEWLVTSETGTETLAEEMGFMIPFEDAKPSSNPLVQAAKEALDEGKKPVAWHFSTIPSDQWKNDLGAALLAYAQGGQTDDLWKKVETAFTDGWKKEYDAANRKET